MTFEELSQELYEDLEGSIHRIKDGPGALYSLRLDFRDWNDRETWRFARLRFRDVKEKSCKAGSCGWVARSEDHVLLWDHNCPRESLHFSGIHAAPHLVLGKIWETHQAVMGDWRPMQDYWMAGADVLACGYGQLAAGPLPLMEHYARALEGLVKFSRVPVGDFGNRERSAAFLLDGGYVIAGAMELDEVDPFDDESPESEAAQHVGYCISCYDNEGPVYSVPLDVSPADMRVALGKEWPIDATPLTREEFFIVRSFLIGDAELVWSERYEFLVEGMNLPVGWEG